MVDVNEILSKALDEISSANDLASLDSARVKYLGKKGVFIDLMLSLKEATVDEKPVLGQLINKAKVKIQEAISHKKTDLENKFLEKKLLSKKIDVTLPASGTSLGTTHIISQVEERIVKIFSTMGFVKEEGPEIEDDFHNFSALNFGDNHPAREMQDTFYLPNDKLLRTHTSNVQVRTLLKQKNIPLKVISSGRVYRCDSDLTHTPMFHQLEGFIVDKDVSFANLKHTLHYFLEEFFETKLDIRLRSSYFPFTEPSAEIDITCSNCSGSGCKICSQTGWLEILGCGMIHPNVLDNCKIDSNTYQGWAFGVGLDRLAMLYHNIPDLRLLFENDIRFLSQF